MEKIVVIVDSEIRELIPTFIQNRYADIVLLRSLVSKKDSASIIIMGHSMKGYGSGYGFHRISDIGASLEASAKALAWEQVEVAIEQLKDYLEQIEIVYD